MFSAFPSPIMEAAFGRLHNGGPAAFGRRPTVVKSIMGAGDAANIAKTYANGYQFPAYAHILAILSYSPYCKDAAIGNWSGATQGKELAILRPGLGPSPRQ